jgi:excisionase family DNA binding protein
VSKRKFAAFVSPVVAVSAPALPAPINPTEILTPEQLAERLQVSPRWIYEKCRRRCDNPLPALRPGRYLRFVWSDVSAWLRSQGRAA